MSFVGLTECFAEAAALFMATHPGREYPRMVPHARSYSGARNATLDEQRLCAAGFDDWADAAVFHAAARRFFSLLAAPAPVTMLVRIPNTL